MNQLTRAQYEDAIDALHANEKRQLLDRWDAGEIKHRKPLDLDDGRDWVQEAREERLDERAYTIFEIERLRRLAEKTMKNLDASRRGVLISK